MKTTNLFLLLLISFFSLQCKKEKTQNEQAKVANNPFILNDSLELLKKLFPKKNNFDSVKINYFKATDLYGSKDSIIFIETKLKEPESFIEWTGRKQFILNKSHEILFLYSGDIYSFIKPSPNDSPFLILTEKSNKGNGIHHIFGMEEGKIKDFLDYKDITFGTIGRKAMDEMYEPETLAISFVDKNNDTFADVLFLGETINLNTKKRSKIEYVFLYDSTAKSFVFKK